MKKVYKQMIGVFIGLSIFSTVLASTIGTCQPNDGWGCTDCWFSPPICDMTIEVSEALMKCQETMDQNCQQQGMSAFCESYDLNWTTCSATCTACKCFSTTGGGEPQSLPEWE